MIRSGRCEIESIDTMNERREREARFKAVSCGRHGMKSAAPLKWIGGEKARLILAGYLAGLLGPGGRADGADE